MSDQDTQACSTCGEMKPMEAFSKCSRAINGRAKRCKPCHSEANARSQRKKSGDIRLIFDMIDRMSVPERAAVRAYVDAKEKAGG